MELQSSSPADQAPLEALKKYQGSTILITGGAGFIGSALVNALSKISCQIKLILRPGRLLNPSTRCPAEITTVHGDIRERDTWNQALDRADYVFHLAGQTSGYLANQDPMGDLQANVTPVLQMLEACRLSGYNPAILFSGTVTQVGLPSRLPVNESHQDLPVTVYDIHKLAAEKYIQYYANNFGVPGVTLRLSNVYGPGTTVGSTDRGVLNRMIVNALSGKPLTIYGDGARVRDYIFVDDVVSAFLGAGSQAASISGNYYVVGSGEAFRIVNAINLVADRVNLMLGYRPIVEHISPPESQAPIEERDFVADTGRFQSATGWTPRVALADGIDTTIQSLLPRREAAQTDSS